LKFLYSHNIGACKWFLRYFMDTKAIKDLLLECSNESIRIGVADLVISVLKV